MSTEAVAHPDDLQANDLGGWVNNAMQKELLQCEVGVMERWKE